MNLIGQYVAVMSSKDPTQVGRKGLVLLETANTFVLSSLGATVRIPKAGSTFQVLESSKTLKGTELSGRLEDRLGRRTR